jgi:dCMP deaminase
MDWDAYFARIVVDVAAKSQDKSSRYGAVIVDTDNIILATGYNGIPRNITYREAYHNRPDKYMYFVHAEQNAVFNAARVGTPIGGARIYTIHPPCAECTKAIIQSGIVEVVYEMPLAIPSADKMDVTDWRMTMDASQEMLYTAGVAIRQGRGLK